MANPRFSVVIPTRNRHETLEYAIKTCITQDFDDYELIVCDNNSSGETKQVIEEINNSKITYVRSETDLAMSDNWELAISKASGEYVIVIGDDDGLLPHALRNLDKIIKKTSYKVIRWDKEFYNWTSMFPNNITNAIHFNKPSITQILNSRSVISDILVGKLPYDMLPMLYNAAVHISLIEALKQKSGRVFSSIVPDIYSGFAFAYLSETYLSLGTSLSINGCSAKSNGTAAHSKPEEDPINSDFNKLNLKSTLSFHPCVPYVKSIYIAIVEPFLQLKNKLFPKDDSLSVDRKLIIKLIINTLRYFDKEDFDKSINAILESNKDNANLYSYAKKQTSKIKYAPHDLNKINQLKTGFTSASEFVIDASVFGIKDIYEASLMFEKILNNKDFELDANQLRVIPKTLLSPYRRIRTALRILIKGY